MFDSQMFLRSSTAGNLTSTETSAAFSVLPTPLAGLSCTVIVPNRAVGTTLDVTLQESTDGTTYTTFETFTTLASVTAASTVPVVQRRRFFTRCQNVRSVVTVAGTSPNFGAVQIILGDQDMPNWLGWQTQPSTADII